MLYVHRWASLIVGLLVIYIAVTGLWMQSMDLFAHTTNQPSSDPTIQEFRQHLNGTDNYAVVSEPDYTSRSLPAGLDIEQSLARIAATARAAAPGQPMRFVELRMIGNRAAAVVKMGDGRFLYDVQTQKRMPDALLPPANPNEITHGLRASMKSWHKFAFNKFMLQKASIFNLIAGIGVLVLMYTGITHYLRLLKARRKVRKPELFWSAGGFWRKFHRWTATVSAVLILYLVVTGMLMAVSDLGAAYAEWKSPRTSRPKNPDSADYSSPLKDAELAAMTRATIAAFAGGHQGVPIRVFRLRYFAGYPQGAIVTGEDSPVQHVYDTRNGRELSLTEPGYPITNFPFGWQWHQTVKQFHRGDFFGRGGNWLEWLSGISLLYLSVSGLWMYYGMWRKRANTGRPKIVWR
jgi:uncharacterized iron-regulated membrane protein